MNQKFTVINTLIASSLFFGCGKKDSETATPAPITEASFAGNWESVCATAADNTSSKSSMVIGTDKTVKQTAQSYSDANCANKLYAVELYSTLAIAGDVDGTTKKVNLSATDVKFINNTETLTQAANQELVCGYSDWATNVGKSCLGKSIAGNGQVEITSTTKIYNIFKVDGNTLSTGAESKVEAQRPTTLKPAYTKK